jgi:hypothetical protein
VEGATRTCNGFALVTCRDGVGEPSLSLSYYLSQWKTPSISFDILGINISAFEVRKYFNSSLKLCCIQWLPKYPWRDGASVGGVKKT